MIGSITVILCTYFVFLVIPVKYIILLSPNPLLSHCSVLQKFRVVSIGSFMCHSGEGTGWVDGNSLLPTCAPLVYSSPSLAPPPPILKTPKNQELMGRGCSHIQSLHTCMLYAHTYKVLSKNVTVLQISARDTHYSPFSKGEG